MYRHTRPSQASLFAFLKANANGHVNSLPLATIRDHLRDAIGITMSVGQIQIESTLMAKRSSLLKLPDDFLGTVAALLNTPPPPKKAKPKRKAKKAGKKR